MEHAVITLYLNLTDSAPQGPGWYVYATMDDQTVIAPIAIEPETALKLSGAFLTALEAADAEIPQITPFQIVNSGNGLIRAAVEKALTEAEASARKVALLRRKLAMMTPVNPEPNAKVE